MQNRAILRFFLLGLLLSTIHSQLSTARAAVVHASYSFSDFTTRPLNVKRVTVTPLAAGADYDGAQLSNKPLIYAVPTYYMLTNGSITISNLVVGYAYKVAFSDGFSEPAITNYFSTNITTGAVVDGNDYKTTYIQWANGVAVQIWFAYLSNTNSTGGTTYTNNTGLPGVVLGSGIGTNLSTLATQPGLAAGSYAMGGKVRLIHNGVSTNSFTTITAAKAAAVAGDLIWVSAGTYNENDLTKPGVNIHFDPGVTLWHAPTLLNPRGIFDDAGGATTNRITGRPNIYWAHSTNGADIVNSLGAIIQTNALTSWTMELGVLDGTSLATSGDYPHLIVMNDGTQSSFDCISIICTPIAASGQILGGIVWRGGEMFVRAINIGSFANYAIWPDEPLTGRTNNMWITADLCEGYIYGSCVTTNFRSWMTFKEIKRSSYGFTGSAMAFIGGYQYVTALKISALDSPIVDLATGAKLWLNAQKITRKGADDESILVRAGTHLVANVAEFEDTGTTAIPVVRNHGTVEMYGGFYSGKAPFLVTSVTTEATQTRLSSMMINTSSGTNAAVIATTTNITLSGVVLTSATTTNAYVATSGAQTNSEAFPARMFCFLNKTNFAAQSYGSGDNPLTNFNYSVADGFRVNVGQGIVTNTVAGYYRVSALVTLTADAATSAAIHVRFKLNGSATSLFVAGGGSGLFTTDILTYIDQKDFSAEEIIFMPANSWLQVVVNSDSAITPSVYNATLCITHL